MNHPPSRGRRDRRLPLVVLTISLIANLGPGISRALAVRHDPPAQAPSPIEAAAEMLELQRQAAPTPPPRDEGRPPPSER